jgi:thiosulfate/3-mercaptopyruvate sulfurtransferase
VLRLHGPIVSVEWLASHATDPALRIADTRWSATEPAARVRYDRGHIPGAVFLDVENGLSSPGEGPGRHPIPAREKLEQVLSEAGIGDEHVLVAYDDAGGSIAARAWWLYRHFGRDGRCAVLDGGITAWTDAGFPLSTEGQRHAPARWTAGEPRDDVVGADDVALLGEGAVLLDARAIERYRGEAEPIDARAGHIPGALSAPFAGNLDGAGRFLAEEALLRRYRSFGALDRPVVAYCGSGITATHDLLAMELAGIAGGRLYEGSWSDWSSDPERPIATGPEA